MPYPDGKQSAGRLHPDCGGSVSYTHLDVYKRQIEYGVNMSKLIDTVREKEKGDENE